MGILAYWPLVFLVFVPIILLLYLLKQRAKTTEISSLYLWKEAFKNMEATTPWEKLKHNLLMYLQIFIVLLLVFALMGPYLKKGGDEYKNVILILDNSGSMNALYDGENTRLATAKEKAKDYLEGLSYDVQVSIVSCNQSAKLELSNGTDKKVLGKIIDQIEDTQYPGDLKASIPLVESMVNQWESYEAVFFSDQGVDLNSIHGKLVSLESQGPNGAVDFVSHSFGKDDEMTVLAKVTNYGTTQWDSDVNLYLGDTMFDVKHVSLSPGENEFVYFNTIPPADYGGIMEKDGFIKAELQEKDVLNQDNISYAQLKRNQPKKILLVTKQNIFLEKAIKIQDNIELYKTTDADSIPGWEEEPFDLYVFDGVVPNEIPKGGNLIFLDPEEGTIKGEEEFFTVGEKQWAVRVTAVKTSITESILPFTFGVNQYHKINRPSWAEDFFQAGKDSIGFYGHMDGRSIAVLAFDLHQSDLPLRTEFPIFIYHLLNQSLESSLLKEKVLTAGDSITVYNSSKTKEMIIDLPNGEKKEIPVSGMASYYTDTNQSGLYKLTHTIEKEKNEAYFAVNFPVSSESKIGKAVSVTGEEKTEDSILAADKIQGGKNLRGYVILAGLVFLLAEWLVYRRTFRIPKKGKGMVIRVLRSAVAFSLILALLDLNLTLSSKKTSTVFLLDVSDSAAGYTKEAENFIKEALKQMPSKEQAGVVAFGKDARVEQFVTNKNLFTKTETTPVTTATNLEHAVLSAMALYPENTGKRLVFITDGKETEGSLLTMMPTIKENQVAVEILKIGLAGQKEVYINKVIVPEKVDLGDTFPVEVIIQSNVKTSANLILLSGSKRKAEKQVEIETGENRFLFQDRQTASGLKSYHVLIEPLEDTNTVNNEYSAFTRAEAGEKVLLIEGKSGEGEAFEKVLKGANINYEITVPETAPRTMMELNEYKSILLLNVYADDLPIGFHNNIESYVKDYTGGLIAIGGEDSFALGNYRNTPLEQVLPVSMDLEGEKEVPETAIALVLDHSGSMSSGEGAVSLLELAKQAAAESLKSLRKTDFIGVLAFESSYDWIVPIQKAVDTDKIEENIYGIPLGGGTSIYPALEEAYEKVSACEAKVKHIILLTDGQDGNRSYSHLLEKMNQNHVTLSTVAVGEGADKKLLENLADSGGGRFYITDIHSDLPRIFAKEVFLSAKSYLVQEEFTPIISSSSEIIQSVSKEGLPSMLGYIASSKKDLATAHLVSHRNDPILTTWQYGLGKTVAFNSDGEGKWTANYNKWKAYPDLWKNIINWTITNTEDGKNYVSVTTDGSKSHILYKTDQYTKDTKVTGVYTDEKGQTHELQLEATAPGVFEGEETLDQTGVYSASVQQVEKGSVKQSKSFAFAVQYSPEYRFTEENQLLETFALETDGTFLTKPEDVFQKKLPQTQKNQNLTWLFLTIALILFILDVANRRLSFSLHFVQLYFQKSKKIKQKKKDTDIIPEERNVTEMIPEEKKEIRKEKKEERMEKERKVKISKEGNIKLKNNTKREGGRVGQTKKEVLDTSNLLKKKKDRNV